MLLRSWYVFLRYLYVELAILLKVNVDDYIKLGFCAFMLTGQRLGIRVLYY
jgi:hypothetical protein